jgi:hypothetical protein
MSDADKEVPRACVVASHVFYHFLDSLCAGVGVARYRINIGVPKIRFA